MKIQGITKNYLDKVLDYSSGIDKGFDSLSKRLNMDYNTAT